jgi:hypothetical protein
MGITKAILSHFSRTPVQYHRPLSMPAQDRLDAILSSTAHGRAIIAARTTETPATPRATATAPTSTTSTPRATTTPTYRTVTTLHALTPRTTTPRQLPARVPVDTSHVADEPRNSTVAASRKRTRHSGSKSFGMTVAQFTAAQQHALKWNDPTRI